MVCISLFYIHSKKIVHRDLKPKNILSKYLSNYEIFMIIDIGSHLNARSTFIDYDLYPKPRIYDSIE